MSQVHQAMTTKPNSDRILDILEAVRKLAIEYYRETGKPLGITGEMAESEAARLLDLELCAARQCGYDARRLNGVGHRRIQIKGRRIMDGSRPGQRIGTIKQTYEWDSVMLVLLDNEYRATAIYEADRTSVLEALNSPGSKARNERGQLSVNKFKAIGKRIWPTQNDTLKSKR